MSSSKMPNGKWKVEFRYKDYTGESIRKKKEGFKTKKEAQAWEKEFLEKVEGSTNMTFGAMVELYLEDCEHRLKASTFKHKDILIRAKLLPFFGSRILSEITALDIRKWQNEVLKEGYKDTYMRTLNSQLSAVFNFAVKYYNLKNNPARLCGFIGKKYADEFNFWTLEEYKNFMDQVEESNKLCTEENFLIYKVLFWTGMRIGEVLALTLDDIDFNTSKIYVTKTYARINRKDVISTPKTEKSNRNINVSLPILDDIRNYCSKIYGYESDQRIFHTNQSNISRCLDRQIKAFNAKKIRIHDFRHSHASLLIDMGVSPLLISERLGHENVETTLRVYSHLYPNKHEEVATKLTALI